MTEQSVGRVMLAASIAAAALLTILAVGGLVVISRGPQAQALPLVRIQIAESAPVPTDPVAGPTATDPTEDHPSHIWASDLSTTSTTALLVAALDESGDTYASTRTTRRGNSGSRASTNTSPGNPPLAVPATTATTARAVSPPTTRSASSPTTATASSPTIVRPASSPTVPLKSTPSTATHTTEASTAPGTTTTTAPTGQVRPERERDREVIRPEIRESGDERRGD